VEGEMSFEIGEEVATTREAEEWGACTEQLRGRVAGFSYTPGIVLIRINRKVALQDWHESFWRSIGHQIPEREDLWGDRK
jgi:hypothetical protein